MPPFQEPTARQSQPRIWSFGNVGRRAEKSSDQRQIGGQRESVSQILSIEGHARRKDCPPEHNPFWHKRMLPSRKTEADRYG